MGAPNLVPIPSDGDWAAVRKAIGVLAARLGPGGAPHFAGLDVDVLSADAITIPGLTGVLKATAGVIGGSAAHSELGSIGANDHHNQAHVLDGADHTVSGLTAGHVLQALTANTFGFAPAGIPGLEELVEIGTGLELTTGEVLVDSQETAGTVKWLGANGPNQYRQGQSFSLDVASEISKVVISFASANGSPTGDVTVRLETDNAGKPSGTLVHEDATISKPGCTTIAWEEFTFPSNIAVDAETTYWVVIRSLDQASSVTRNIYAKAGGEATAMQEKNLVWDAAWGETNVICYRIYAYTSVLKTKDSEIVHDNLSGGGGDKHIDHTTVSITAGTGLTGGGTIASTRSLSLSHLGLQSLTSPGADRLMFWDHSELALKWLTASTGLSITGTTLTTNDSQIAHNSLSGYAADNHIAHSGVSVIAGTGMSGGGTIATDRTLNCTITQYTDALARAAMPTTTLGDLITGGASGAVQRLGVGSEGHVLTVSSGVPAWVAAASGFANPMTAAGDLILGGAGGAAGRLGIGANTYVLTSNGTTAAWAASAGGSSTPTTQQLINNFIPNYRLARHQVSVAQRLLDGYVESLQVAGYSATDESTGNNQNTTYGYIYPTNGDLFGSYMQPEIDGGQATVGDSNGTDQSIAQSFTLGGSGHNCSAVSACFGANLGGATDQVTCRIETNNAGAPSGTLAHANATKTMAVTANQWNTFVFPADFALTASTTYWIVLTMAGQATNVGYGVCFSTTAGKTGQMARKNNGTGVWTTTTPWDSRDMAAVEIIPEGTAPVNMTLALRTTDASAVPTTAFCTVMVQELEDVITINTDLKGWVSRDSGANYAQVTLALSPAVDPQYKLYYGTVDISGIASGTNMRFKVTTHNNLQVYIRGMCYIWY